jgi:FkbM family methyltransferase
MKKFIRSILSHFDLDIHRKSLYEKSDDPIHVLEMLFENIDLKTIIDGGASIGNLTRRFSNAFPDARVHAFEPYQPHFDALQEVANNNKRIIPVKKGLSNRNGNRSFFQNQASGTNSFLKATEQGQAIYGDQLKEIGQTEVECISLDHYLQSNKIESIDLLKLDLQGGEVDALQGASKSLAAGKIKCILCEVMFERHYKTQPSAGKLLNDLIERFDFTLFNFYQSNYHRGRLIYSDALLFHPSILDQVGQHSNRSFHAHSRLPIIP